MERSKIPMLSRFDAISHIMPYYGQTHKAFFLLSGLCSETRRKLDEFYDEFVTLMKEYWMFYEIKQSKEWSLFIPNDLFEFSIDCTFKETIDSFIEFIENLKDSEGWYFNSHYMHSKIKIRDPIKVDIDFIMELYPYVDVLKSTQVILCKKDFHTSKVQYESGTLDTICNFPFLYKDNPFFTLIMLSILFFLKWCKFFKLKILF